MSLVVVVKQLERVYKNSEFRCWEVGTRTRTTFVFNLTDNFLFVRLFGFEVNHSSHNFFFCVSCNNRNSCWLVDDVGARANNIEKRKKSCLINILSASREDATFFCVLARVASSFMHEMRYWKRRSCQSSSLRCALVINFFEGYYAILWWLCCYSIFFAFQKSLLWVNNNNRRARDVRWKMVSWTWEDCQPQTMSFSMQTHGSLLRW